MVQPNDIAITTDNDSSKEKVNQQVANILDAIKNPKPVVDAPKPATKTPKTIKKKQPNVPRGIAKSGRPWKSVKNKFGDIRKTVFRPSTEKKQAFRQEMKHIKELSKSIKEDKKQENEAKRLRREVNAKRKLENERKSEIVQVIKNPAKIKRMKKKALRKIEKRDLSQVKTV